VALVDHELAVIALAYLMAAMPLGAVVLAGVVNPSYKIPTGDLVRWWSWFALAIVALTIALVAAGAG